MASLSSSTCPDTIFDPAPDPDPDPVPTRIVVLVDVPLSACLFFVRHIRDDSCHLDRDVLLYPVNYTDPYNINHDIVHTIHIPRELENQ